MVKASDLARIWGATRASSPISGRSRDTARAELDLTGLELREVQDAVDEAKQVPLVHLDAFEVRLLLAGDASPDAERHELRIAVDGVERRAELVRHHGAEVRLRRVRQCRSLSIGQRQTAVLCSCYVS